MTVTEYLGLPHREMWDADPAVARLVESLYSRMLSLSYNPLAGRYLLSERERGVVI